MACSFDANRLRALPAQSADGPVEPSDAVVIGGQGDIAIASDAFPGTADALVGTDAGDAPAATGDVGGNDGPTELGDAQRDDGPVATGGANGSDVPLASGGAGGTAGTSDAADSTGGADAGIGEVGSGGTGGNSPAGGAGGGDDSGAGGSADSGGQADSGDSGDGMVVYGTGGAASGGQTDTGSGGVGGGAGSGGTGGGGVDAAADAAGSGGTGGGSVDGAADAAGTTGGTCGGQCPLIATIGITGVWGATYTNGKSGNLVTAGDNTFLTWLASRSANCVAQNLDITGSNYLTPERLAPFQVIVVLDIYHTQADKDAYFNAKKTNPGSPAYLGSQRAILASEANAIRDWVGNGGGFMTTIGISSTAAEMANANLLLHGFQVAYSVTDVNVLQGSSSLNAFSTAPPIASQITAGVGTLPVTGAAGIEGLSGGTLPANSSTFSLYVNGGGTFGRGGYVGGYAIGVARIISGIGHVNVWGDEWITYDAAWSGANGADVQAYWSNVINWLGQCP